MENAILEMQQNLSEGLFIAFVPADDNGYYSLTKSDDIRFLDSKTLLIKRKKISELKNKIIDIQKNQTIGFPKIEKIFPNPTLRNNKKILTINDKNSNNTKIKNISQDICSKFFYKNKKFKYIHIISNKFPTNINTNNNTLIKLFEEKQTQTEEKFFVFHWTYFFGLYKILTANVSQKRINIAYPLLIKYDNRIDFIKNSKYKSTATMVSTSLDKIKLNFYFRSPYMGF